MKALSGKEMCRVLKKRGWTHVRTRGSHRRFEKPDLRPITVPVHRNETLKLGMQRAILKAAGIDEIEL